MIQENIAPAPPEKLTANDAIIKMLVSINTGKTEDFYKILQQYAKQFNSANTTRHRINQLVTQRPMQFKRLDELSSSVKNLLIQEPNLQENVFLNEDVTALADELIEEWSHADIYVAHNLKVRNKILFHGPTGNGKTTIARWIARKTELPFVEVKSEVVVESHIGASSNNIYNIFKSVQQKCVLFWDEVDGIGIKRGSTRKDSASVENDRITNSVLLNLDKLHPEVIFIAATNRMEVLDSAFVRRFDVLFEIPSPTAEEKIHFANQLMDHHKIEMSTNGIDSLTSFSDIKNKVVGEARRIVLEKIKSTGPIIHN